MSPGAGPFAWTELHYRDVGNHKDDDIKPIQVNVQRTATTGDNPQNRQAENRGEELRPGTKEQG